MMRPPRDGESCVGGPDLGAGLSVAESGGGMDEVLAGCVGFGGAEARKGGEGAGGEVGGEGFFTGHG
jgi:hypothetical protein